METEELWSLYLRIPHIPIGQLYDRKQFDYYSIYTENDNKNSISEPSSSIKRNVLIGKCSAEGKNENDENDENDEKNCKWNKIKDKIEEGKKDEDEDEDEDGDEDEDEDEDRDEDGDGDVDGEGDVDGDRMEKKNVKENDKNKEMTKKKFEFHMKSRDIEKEAEELFISLLKNNVKNDSVLKNNISSDSKKIGDSGDIHNVLITPNKKKKKKNLEMNVHLFEQTNLHIKQEFIDEWFHFTPLETFEVINAKTDEFEKECAKIRERLNIKVCQNSTEKQKDTENEKEDMEGNKISEIRNEHYEEKNKESNLMHKSTSNGKDVNCSLGFSKNKEKNTKHKFYEYLIKILMSGIRAPTIEEIIYDIVYYNCYDWQKKVDVSILQNLANVKNYKPVINRTKCVLDWVPKTENNKYNKYQIISKLKKKTLTKTFKLVCDFNNTKLKSMFINHNLINVFHSKNKYPVYTSFSRNASSNSIFIISVSFYQPIRGIKIAEFDLLSTQTLADLTDSFFCFDSMNYGLPRFDGSVYFIDGILYPDLRKKGALDYSKNIINFFKRINEKSVLKYPYKIQQDKAILGKMKIPLFQKCCFLHQGNCEHRIMFTNVRQYNSFRDHEFSKYPLRTFKPNIMKKLCICCHINNAEKMVLDCYLLKENPSYLCNNCFQLFLLDENEKPIDKIMKFFDYLEDI